MAKFISYSCSPYGTTDIKTGTPNISISSGVATLDVAQTGNIGVGCCIEFGTTKVYIAPNRLPFISGGTTELKPGDRITGATSGAKGIVRFVEVTSGSWAGGDAAGYIYFESVDGTFNSSEQLDRDRPSSSTNIATANGSLQGNIGNGNTQFVVKAPTGSDAADQTSTSVTSIHHEWSSLVDLEAYFTDANHLNSTDLTATGADVCVFAACYYDHSAYAADANAVTIDFGTTDSSHYFQAFTPTGGAESINSQRHDGKWNDNKYKLVAASAQGGGVIYSTSGAADVKIQGLQCNNTLVAPASDTGVIKFNSTSYIFRIELDSVIAKFDDTSSTGTTLYHSGLRMSFRAAGTTLHIRNCVVYDVKTPDTTTYTNGILTHAESAYIYDCTVYNCLYGFNRELGTCTVKNCLAQSCTDGFRGTFDASSDYNCSDISSDAPGTNSVTGTVSFVDAANDDYHLASTDTVAKDAGTDLSTDANLPIWRDIDGEDRVGGTWDIGADEYVAAGGQTASLTDSLSLSETLSSLAAYKASLSDTFATSDARTPLAHLLASLDDTTSLTDTKTAIRHLKTSFSDTATFSDQVQVTASFKASTSDTITLTDSLQAVLSALATLADTLTLTDELTYPAGQIASLADTLSLTDSQTAVAALKAAITDTLTLADTQTALAALKSILTDTLNLSDELSTQLIGHIADTLTLSDSITATASFLATLIDTFVTTDSIQGTLHLQVELSDTLTLGEQINALAHYALSLADTLNLTDQITGIKVEATGIVTISFGTKFPGISLSVKQPGVTITGKGPSEDIT